MAARTKTASLDTPLNEYFQLAPAQQAALRKLGLKTISDLFYHFPTRYELSGEHGTVASLAPKTKVTLVGVLSKLQAKKLWKSKRNITEGYFEDGSGRIKVMWFNQPYMASYAPEGVAVQITGTVGGTPEKPYISNPEVIIAKDYATKTGLFKGSDPDNKLFPVYSERAGITSRWFYHAIKKILGTPLLAALQDPIPAHIRATYHLPDLASALMWIHIPEKETHTQAARKRFAFEEIFAMQVAQAQERMKNDGLLAYRITHAHEHLERFFSTLPFPPTGAQRNAVATVLEDFAKTHPMARLLEGDVGSGKTLVAAATTYAVITSPPPGRTSGTLQVAYMAPTEILAKQHFESFIEYFKNLPINIGLITGSGCRKFPSKTARGTATSISRNQLLKWVSNGEIALLVGTHALIQKSLQFKNLAYVIVDEQHRFGTQQRAALIKKHDCVPHFLSMTATPIPRTLALTIYGNLDLSLLDELPPGRAKITTRIVAKNERAACYESIRAELGRGRQAYVICPRIEEPDPKKLNALQAKSAKAEAKRLAKDIFPEYTVGLLHGAMKPGEKDAIMSAFVAGDIHILVATSVVEVGVNVPNATVIVIEGAERFGLAQLHQLRGRVMRSSHAPFCYLLPETTGAIATRRLKMLEKTADGFKLAEADLQNRGAGDLYGKSQWGVSDLGMEALKNIKLIQAARTEAERLIAADPELSQHETLRKRIVQSATELHRE